jgi:hypothetical protein
MGWDVLGVKCCTAAVSAAAGVGAGGAAAEAAAGLREWKLQELAGRRTQQRRKETCELRVAVSLAVHTLSACRVMLFGRAVGC